MSSIKPIQVPHPRDEHASGRFLAALGQGETEADLLPFRALVASDSYAIVALDLDHTFVTWNPGAEKLFGYDASEMVGCKLAMLMTEVDQPISQLPQRIALGETVELDARLRRADGRVVDTFVTATPVRDAASKVVGTALIIRDVTQAQEMKRRLHEVSQLQVMARVAAGVAHDINNVLAIVQAYAEFVEAGPLTTEQANDLRLARDAAKRGASLTGQLLAMNRPREPELIKSDLNQVVRAAEELLRRMLGASVEFATRLAPAPLEVKAAAGQLDQVLLNLVLNARDAMPLGGKLEVSLQSAVVGPEHDAASQLRPGNYARLAVRDTGIGMDDATRQRIFEPFFTTKASGRGSGLGLLVVTETVRELGGGVFVESARDQGSTFTVYLPLIEARPEAPRGSSVQRLVAVPSVLIVDSDPILRMAIARILRGGGYQTLEATDPVEAEAVIRGNPKNIRTVVSDMSGASYASIASIVRELCPTMQLVCLSGLSTDDRREPGYLFVPKPFAAVDLLAAVAKAVDTPTLRPSKSSERLPSVLVVDDDEALAASLVRVLAESDLHARSTKSGLHALQLLQQEPADVVVADQFMPGMDGVKLLELVQARFPDTARILFTAHASPDIVLAAVNRARVSKVLLKNMHPVAIRDEISAVALEMMKKQRRSLLPR
ncbi:MAG TPA: response regulator [Polyangiaceae bacterium]|nr:response regulator [Polyangiaceae bacterium]